MSRHEKGKLSKIIEMIFVFVVIAAFVGIGIGIYSLISNIFKETGKEKESGETSSFVVLVQDRELETSAGGVVFTTSETFSLVTSGTDSEIFAKIKGKKTPQDYVIEATKGGETSTYSWNTDFSVEDMTSFFDVEVDQDANTVTVNGTMKEAVTRYLKRRGFETITFPQNVPTSDMFVLELTQGDASMAIGFHVYAEVYSLSLDELSFC